MRNLNIVIDHEFIHYADALYINLVNSLKWDTRMKRRKTASFGIPYLYSGMCYPKAVMHPLLVPILSSVERYLGFGLNNCLVNYYPDGKSTMGYHSDSLEQLQPGTGIAIVSLGAERQLVFRHKQDDSLVHSVLLASGSLLYMDPGVQEHWLHAVPESLNCGGRISLSFRAVTLSVH